MPRFRMPSIRGELLPEANGADKEDELAFHRANRETEARKEHAQRRRLLAGAAARNMGVLPPDLRDYHPPKKDGEKLGVDTAPHDDNYHIPGESQKAA